ncbi:hypothetical protein AVEN_61027-1 [Araneus ventricosus]|uniref:Uncharacterized protein n=1 Tax=Araneus ventricosus TaxID=182803 RepID=A0A4Y2J211_ARAVE|nr:hypothetical protein AVEN_61027-1 [Araneus ventricosus]
MPITHLFHTMILRYADRDIAYLLSCVARWTLQASHIPTTWLLVHRSSFFRINPYTHNKQNGDMGHVGHYRRGTWPDEPTCPGAV